MSSRSAGPSPTPVVGRSLLVSSDSKITDQLTTGLQQFAISADVCPDPLTAVGLLNTRKFEAVFIDLALGERTGHVFERVRLSPSNQKSVTFALASSAEETFLQVQPNFILRKPLKENEVENTLRAALGLIIRDYRRYFRCPVRLPVVIHISEKAHVGCEMINISEGGFAVATPVTFTPGATVKAEFVLPDSACAFALHAEICWCDHNGHAGLHFREVSEEKKLSLQSWLSRKIEEQIPEPVARLFQKHPGGPTRLDLSDQ